MIESKHRKRHPPDTGPEPGRRSLLKAGWLGLVAVAVTEVAWVGLSFLRGRHPSDTEAASPVLDLGPADRFEPATVTPVPRGGFYLSRLEDGGFLALARECTHLGCALPWVEAEGRFTCPCHASAFDRRGRVLTPPATRPLDLYAVSIENGGVKVRTGTRIRRDRFEERQVVHV